MRTSDDSDWRLPARRRYARQAAALLAGIVLDDAVCARRVRMAAGEIESGHRRARL